MKRRMLLAVALLFLIMTIPTLPSSLESAEEVEPVEPSSNVLGASPVQNVTYRLLAIEQYFDGTPMRSAQWLIMNLTRYLNWQNTTWGEAMWRTNYTSYIHLLSYAPRDPSVAQYYRGAPTNSNVVNEIQNFLSQTGPGESNSLTIRILYYNGHSGTQWNNGNSTYYMCLGTYGSHTSGPSRYQELYDHQLNTLLNHGDLQTNNCTLVMLDTCYSGGFINKLSRLGRVILTACKKDQTAWGWISATPSPGYWAWFTGHESASFNNGSKLPVGIIGGLHNARDSNNDGWKSAGEVWTLANTTAYEYAKDKGRTMNPQRDYYILGGGIPLVMYKPYITIVLYLPPPFGIIIINWERGFVRNAAPGKIFVRPNSDWPIYGSSNTRTGISDANGPGTDPLWTKSLTDPIYSSVAIHEGIVFAGTLGGGGGSGAALYALSWETGEVFWKFTTDSPIYSSPAVHDGAVIFGTDDGRIIALEEYSGMVRWVNNTQAEGPVRSSPAVADGMVFVGSSDGYIQAFNETTGWQAWNLSIGGQVESSPAVQNGRVFVGTTGEPGLPSLYALDETSGSIIWTALIENPVLSTPAVADGMVFVGTMGGMAPPGLYVFDDSGTPVWDYPLPAPVSSSPAVDSSKGIVTVGCMDGHVYAFNEFTMPRLNWSTPLGGPVEMSSPAISKNGYLYVGSMNGIVYCLNETSGSIKWEYQTGGPIQASPAITDDHIIVGSDDGNLYSFGPPNPVHDIVALNAEVSNLVTSPGRGVNITYTVKNNGNIAETFNVTIAYNTTQVWTAPLYNQTVTIAQEEITLGPSATTTRTYEWDTTGLDYGYYTISIHVSTVSEETSTANNSWFDSTVMITVPGDADGDKTVNVFDILKVKYHWFPGPPLGPGGYNRSVDLDDDGSINVFDILIVKANWGQSW